MDFITIDFETATPDRDSPCEIGLTFVEKNEIKDVKSWLIKPSYYPYFDNFNMSIHGITPNDVKTHLNLATLDRNKTTNRRSISNRS
jgi:DNA polymerase-3 subunit epsilon